MSTVQKKNASNKKSAKAVPNPESVEEKAQATEERKTGPVERLFGVKVLAELAERQVSKGGR